jgi:hypothetical protein
MSLHLPSLRGLLIAAAIVAPLALDGCAASTSPNWDQRFGDGTRGLLAQQLLAPDAPRRNAAASAPSDGRTVRESVDRQLDSYRAPPATNVINIGVGSGGGTPNR